MDKKNLTKLTFREEWGLAKQIVKSAKYPVDSMPNLWNILATFHREELSQILKLAEIALTLPLHTCSCERVFSQQNLIVTKLRSRLNPSICDRLLRVRLEGKGLKLHDYQETLELWKKAKNRLLKRKTFLS